VKNLDALLSTKLDDLILSIDGIKKETYESYRLGAKYEDMIEKVSAFLKAKVKGGYDRPYVRIQTIWTKDTEDEIEDFVNKWLKIPGVDNVFLKNLDGMNPWLGDKMVKTSEVDDINKNRLPCSQLWLLAAIFWNGDMSGCCHDAHGDLVVGNIRESKIKDIWHSQDMHNLRKRHMESDYPEICKNCVEWWVW